MCKNNNMQLQLQLPSIDSLMQIPAQMKDTTTTTNQMIREENPCLGSLTFRNPWIVTVEHSSENSFCKLLLILILNKKTFNYFFLL